MNVFVGNLSFSATGEDVKKIFEAFGVVTSVSIKKKSGQNSRGFGFVNMPDDVQAQTAITALHGKEFMGRPLSVSVQRPKAVKPKKNYKEIKELRHAIPVIPEKRSPKFSKPAGTRAWEKRKGRGTSKPWKKTPGGVHKKFKYER